MISLAQTFILRSSSFLIAAASLAALVGCAGKKPPQKPSAPIAIGKVALVNRSLEFILIDTHYTPPPGTPLRSVAISGDETSLLTVSQEKKRPFIIANIDEGEPRVGDRVIMEPQYLEENVEGEQSEILLEPAADLPATQ